MHSPTWFAPTPEHWRRNLRAIGLFGVFYFAFAGLLLWQHERLVYQPPNSIQLTCPSLPEASLHTVNGTRMYVVAHPERMVIVYPGNAGTACDRAHYADWITNAGWGYILVNYSGYADGTGRPSHERIKVDVQNVTAFIKELDVDNIAIIGESLGAAVAGLHTKQMPPEDLLLITPFDTLDNVARYHYWYLPTRWVTLTAYDTVAALASYQGQVTILHGTHDEVIPLPLAYALYDALSTPSKKFITIDGASHNTLLLNPETQSTINEFLQFSHELVLDRRE